MPATAAARRTAVAHAQVVQGTRLHLTPVERIGTTAALVVLAAVVGFLSVYGWRNGAALLPRALAPEQVPHRLAVLRRGAVACGVVAVALVAAAVLVALQ